MRGLALALLIGMILASDSAVAAGRPGVEALARRVRDMEGRLAELEQALADRTQEGSEAERARRRLTDAQVLYTLRNYEAAATILFDVVDRYAKTPAYPDAVFYLAEALYQKRDFLSARRFFEKLVQLTPQHARYQEGLVRLLEIALHLQVFDRADMWLERLAQVPRERALAASPYVRGKYYFFQKDYERAVQVLAEIQPQSPYYFQARYFIGAARVAQGRLEEAQGEFLQLVARAPRTDEERRIVELGHLALGRIYHEQGQSKRAEEAYTQISQKSDLFPDALYESAWTAIRAKEYRQALRRLELLVLAQPDAVVIPEAKLLIGNLLIRVGDHRLATQWFERTRDEFLPVHRKLDELLQKGSDPGAHFRELIRKNLSKFDVSLVVPGPADRYLRGDREIGRFTTLATDVSDLRRSLAEAESAVAKLEKALAGPQRYHVDPQLGQTRAAAVQMSGELMGLRRQLAEAMLGVVAEVSSADEVRRAGELARRRVELEKDLARAIASAGAKSRADQLRAQANELDKRASDLAVHVEALRKQRAAIEQYYAQTKKQQKIPQAQFDKEISEVKAQEAQATEQLERLRRELAEVMSQAGEAEQEVSVDDQVQRDYSQVVKQERELLGTMFQRLRGPIRLEAEQVWGALERSFVLDERLKALMARVHQLLDVKLAEAQAVLVAERENVRSYRQQLDSTTSETEEVGGGLLLDVLRQTARRFYDIVVRSDIGIIDVAWAIKQQHTERISRLVREQRREQKLLDAEFQEVLKE
ncbi:MAG: tetratricopeptide repeat protein [Myxococcales bacterium]|nr:tetratricopeptide repeat protein [Myxococcales bacterium]